MDMNSTTAESEYREQHQAKEIRVKYVHHLP